MGLPAGQIAVHALLFFGLGCFFSLISRFLPQVKSLEALPPAAEPAVEEEEEEDHEHAPQYDLDVSDTVFDGYGSCLSRTDFSLL